MIKMNISEIMRYAYDNSDINYIAHVSTPMTVIWAKVCLFYMHEKMKIDKLKGIFVVNAWTEGKWAIEKELPLMSGDTPWLEKSLWVLNDNSNPGIRKNVNRKVKKTKASRVVYMIDTDVLWLRPSILTRKYFNIDLRHIYIEFDKTPFGIREEIVSNWLLIKENGLFPIARMYTRRLAANIGASIYGVDVNRIHGYDRKKFFSDLYIEYVRKVLESEGNEYNILPTKYVIYLSNPYQEDDAMVVAHIAEETLIKYYEKGYKIFVKQHPRETGEVPFKNISVEYLPREYAIESIIATSAIKPKAIIAGSTSAIIEIARIWKNIDCYSILNDDRIRGHVSLEWFRNYTNCAISKIPNLMDATQCKE